MTSKKLRERKMRAKKMSAELEKLFPSAKIALKYKNSFQLLVSVILSAQCTDERVNTVTRELFKKYKSIDDFARAHKRQLEKDIKSTGFYKNKAKNIIAAARAIKDKHSGQVPQTMEELVVLPGVARKTANVVLGNAFGKIEGIVVDTHVKRFAQKFDLTDSKDPKKIEQDLMEILPKKEWFLWTYRMIEYGRRICPARKHDCSKHPLTKVYPPAARKWPKSR